MAALIRLRNDSGIPQIFNLRGASIRVVPRGTVVVEPTSYVMKARGMTQVATIGEPEPKQDAGPSVEELLAKIAELQARLRDDEDEPYPRHQGGGKWLLSNGEITRGQLSREAARGLEDELNEHEE